MGNFNQPAPLPENVWKKWVKNLNDDPENSDYLKFNNIAIPREFYEKVFKNTDFYPYVYYGLSNDGNFCFIIVQAELKNDKVKVKSDDYYVFEANKPFYKVDKKECKQLCKKWKDLAKSHKIKLKAFSVPKENFKNIFSDEAASKLYFFMGENTEATTEYEKIKPLMSGKQLKEVTTLGGGDPGDPNPIYNDTIPCPPLCDEEPGGGG